MSDYPRGNNQNGPGHDGASRRSPRAAAHCSPRLAAEALFALVLLLALLAGCRSDPEDDPANILATLAATAVPVAVVTTPTAAPSATPPPATPAATAATASPAPTPCSFAVLPALQFAYLDIELGCPITPGQTGLSTAYTPFAGGQMLWRGDNGRIYVLYNDGRWAQYDDLWREGDPEFTCGQPPSPPTPKRGFGRVWCDHADVREGLGDATADEIGDAGGAAQDFVNGLLLAGPDGSTFILVGETATWRRVWPNE